MPELRENFYLLRPMMSARRSRKREPEPIFRDLLL